MVTFSVANQVRLALKMKLFRYAWYTSSRVIPQGDEYVVVIAVKKLDDQVRKLISPVMSGVSVRTELE